MVFMRVQVIDIIYYSKLILPGMTIWEVEALLFYLVGLMIYQKPYTWNYICVVAAEYIYILKNNYYKEENNVNQIFNYCTAQ